MSRPTREQLDGMLGVDVYDCDGSAAKAIAENLQAEVRALREEARRGSGPEMLRLELQIKRLQAELAKLREELAKEREILDNVTVERDDYLAENPRLRDERDTARQMVVDQTLILGRVEALPARWREPRSIFDGIECADELEAALKG